jgi:hypothetical protein
MHNPKNGPVEGLSVEIDGGVFILKVRSLRANINPNRQKQNFAIRSM